MPRDPLKSFRLYVSNQNLGALKRKDDRNYQQQAREKAYRVFIDLTGGLETCGAQSSSVSVSESLPGSALGQSRAPQDKGEL